MKAAACHRDGRLITAVAVAAAAATVPLVSLINDEAESEKWRRKTISLDARARSRAQEAHFWPTEAAGWPLSAISASHLHECALTAAAAG